MYLQFGILFVTNVVVLILSAIDFKNMPYNEKINSTSIFDPFLN